MARTNKYTSFNFNDIFDKSTPSSSSTSRSPSSPSLSHKSYSLSASSRLSHGGMLVLSRPSQPKPQPPPPQQPPPQQPPPQPQPQPQPPPNPLDFPAITSPLSSKPLDSDSLISLRPLGKTGGTPSFHEREINTNNHISNNNKVDVPSPKSNKFVPPHLRPGYVPKEVPPVPEFQKPKAGNFHHRPGPSHGNYHGSSGNGYSDNGRPMSGGGGGYSRPGSAHDNYHGSGNGYGDNSRPMSGGGGYHRPGSAHGNYYHGSNNMYVDDGRPKSGGGYDRRMRGPGAPPHLAGVESESFSMNRPRSGGSRPNSRG